MIDSKSVKWTTRHEAVGRKYDQMGQVGEFRISGHAPTRQKMICDAGRADINSPCFHSFEWKQSYKPVGKFSPATSLARGK